MTTNIENHYNQHSRRLIKSMTYRCGTEWAAQDIVQEAYARALKYNTNLEGKDLNLWFSMLMHNVYKDFLREENKHPQTTFDEELSEGVDCPQYSSEIMKEVYDLIATKSLVYIEILTLYFSKGYTAVEICQATAHSHSQCKQVLARFKQELKELYG